MALSKGVRQLGRDNVQHRTFERPHTDGMSDMPLGAQTDCRCANPDGAIPARSAVVMRAATHDSTMGRHILRRRLSGSTRAADS